MTGSGLDGTKMALTKVGKMVMKGGKTIRRCHQLSKADYRGPELQ